MTPSARRRRRWVPTPRHLGAAVALGFVAACYAWPVGAIVWRGVFGSDGRGAMTWSVVRATLGNERLWRLVRFTLLETSLSVAATLALGVPLGWVLGRYEFRGRRALLTASIVPFVLPSVVVGAAVASLVPSSSVSGRSGAVNVGLIVAAHVILNLGIVVRTVAAFASAFDPRVEAAARTLGRGRLGAWRDVVAPLARPVVAALALIVALFTSTSFGVIVALGGASQGTIEVEIWYQTTQLFDLPVATVLALVQMVVVVALVVAYQRLLRRRAVAGSVAVAVRRHAAGRRERAAVVAASLVVMLVVVVPIAALVVRSLHADGAWTLAHYRHLGSTLASTSLAIAPLDAVRRSLVTSFVAAAIALCVALPAAWTSASGGRLASWVDRAVMLPLGTSAATIGFGFLLAFSGPVLDLRDVWVIVPLIQATVAVPLVVRTLVPALRSVPHALVEAAGTCGAGWRRRLAEVVVPLVRRPLVSAAGLAVAVSLGEFGATSFVSRADAPTVPIVIGRLLGRPGTSNLGQAMALSCILAALCAVVFALVDRAAQGRTGEF